MYDHECSQSSNLNVRWNMILLQEFHTYHNSIFSIVLRNRKLNITSFLPGPNRVARRSSVNTVKPPPPVRRSSSVTPSPNIGAVSQSD